LIVVVKVGDDRDLERNEAARAVVGVKFDGYCG